MLTLSQQLLWLAWLLLLLPSFVLDGEWRTPLRLSSSIVLVILAILTVTRSSLHRSVGSLIAAGMLFGCLGDFAMASLIPLFSNRVIGGMLFFGIGHLCYIAGVEWYRQQLGFKRQSSWWIAVICWQTVGLLGWYFVVHSSEKHLVLHYPALAYGALLAATAGVTLALAVVHRTALPIAAGAALFLLSDMVLAWQIFHGSNALTNVLVWATYGPGQMLIVMGFARILLSPLRKSSAMASLQGVEQTDARTK